MGFDLVLSELCSVVVGGGNNTNTKNKNDNDKVAIEPSITAAILDTMPLSSNTSHTDDVAPEAKVEIDSATARQWDKWAGNVDAWIERYKSDKGDYPYAIGPEIEPSITAAILDAMPITYNTLRNSGIEPESWDTIAQRWAGTVGAWIKQYPRSSTLYLCFDNDSTVTMAKYDTQTTRAAAQKKSSSSSSSSYSSGVGITQLPVEHMSHTQIMNTYFRNTLEPRDWAELYSHRRYRRIIHTLLVDALFMFMDGDTRVYAPAPHQRLIVFGCTMHTRAEIMTAATPELVDTPCVVLEINHVGTKTVDTDFSPIVGEADIGLVMIVLYLYAIEYTLATAEKTKPRYPVVMIDTIDSDALFSMLMFIARNPSLFNNVDNPTQGTIFVNLSNRNDTPARYDMLVLYIMIMKRIRGLHKIYPDPLHRFAAFYVLVTMAGNDYVDRPPYVGAEKFVDMMLAQFSFASAKMIVFRTCDIHGKYNISTKHSPYDPMYMRIACDIDPEKLIVFLNIVRAKFNNRGRMKMLPAANTPEGFKYAAQFGMCIMRSFAYFTNGHLCDGAFATFHLNSTSGHWCDHDKTWKSDSGFTMTENGQPITFNNDYSARMYTYRHHGNKDIQLAIDKTYPIASRARNLLLHTTLGIEKECPTCTRMFAGIDRDPSPPNSSDTGDEPVSVDNEDVDDVDESTRTPKRAAEHALVAPNAPKKKFKLASLQK